MDHITVYDIHEKSDRITFDFSLNNEISIESLSEGEITDIRISRKQFETIMEIYLNHKCSEIKRLINM